MLIKIIFVIILIIIAILVYASTKPETFHVERSVTIKAPPEKIFPLINDFHAWNDWTPYNKDPAMKKTYSGSNQGVGAAYAWEGNKQVGRGDITITATTPPNNIEFDLHMIEPFEGRNKAVFTLAANGDSTNVTWSLDDKHNLMLKTMTIFVNLNNVIGNDFEVGLAKLKTLVERQ